MGKDDLDVVTDFSLQPRMQCYATIKKNTEEKKSNEHGLDQPIRDPKFL